MITNTFFLGSLTIVLGVLASPQLSAHTRLKGAGNTLVPRSNNAGIKTGPCGGLPRSATPAIFKAGETIRVNWEETIDHPGRFEFYFSPANDQNFSLIKTVIDDQDGPVGATPHQFSTSLTLPNTPCEACTIQLIQVMTENPASPSLYYSCSDIKLQANSTTPTTGPVTTTTCAPAK
ncbi:MAG: lytic polysaccharide monooxygenase [Bdellovibrionales bacterium]|nr:lytic polysaccharide monooxygenase [Bdellovibrionales bacterium]